MWLWKTPTHLHIWVYEYLRYKYLSKSRDQVVMRGKSAPAVLLFRGIPAVQYSWLTDTSPEWRYLQYCFIKLIFQYDTVLYLYLFKIYSICVMSVCKQKVYIMWRKYVKLKQINIVFFKFIHPLLNTRQGKITWISLPLSASMSPWVILNRCLLIASV